MDNDLPTSLPLAKILEGRQFGVADFQRDYKWDDSLVLGLFHSAYYKHYMVDDPFYLQTVCVYPADEFMYIVDGQQRLTTLLLGAAAAFRVGGEHTARLEHLFFDTSRLDENVPKLRFPHVPGADEALGKIFAGETPAVQPGDDDTIKSLVANYETLLHWTENLVADVGEVGLAKFWTWLQKKLVMTYYPRPTRQKAIDYYIDVNTKNASLTPAELVKGLLYSAADAAGCTPAVERKWNDVFKKGVRLDASKQLHRLLNGLYATEAEDIKVAAMFDWVDRNRTAIGVDTVPLEFMGKLEVGANTLRNFFEHKTPSGNPNAFVKLACVNAGTRKNTLPVVVAAGHLDDSAFGDFAFRLTGFDTLMSVSGLRGNDVERFIRALIVGVRAASNTADLQALFDRVVGDLMAVAGTTIDDALYNNSFTGGVGTKVVRMLALSYEPNKEDAIDAILSCQIEHVYPKSAAKNGDPWNGNINGGPAVCPSAGSLNRLGNMVLLSRGANASASNADFAHKRPFYGNEQLIATKVLAYDSAPQNGMVKAQRVKIAEALDEDGPRSWDDSRIVARSRMAVERVRQVCGATP